MKTTKSRIASLILIILSTYNNTNSQNRNSSDIQLDPTPFFLNGYAGEVGYSINKHRIYLTGVSYEAPDFLKEDKKFNEKRNFIIGIGYQYYFKEKLKKLYFGCSILDTKTTYTNPTTNNSVQLENFRISTRIGYVIYPFKKIKFFINPWIGPYLNINAKGATIDDLVLKRKTIYYTTTIQLGYKF